MPDRFEQLMLPHLDAAYNLARWLADRKSTRLNSSHLVISYAVFCLKKKISLGYEVYAGTSARASAGVIAVFEADSEDGNAAGGLAAARPESRANCLLTDSGYHSCCI